MMETQMLLAERFRLRGQCNTCLRRVVGCEKHGWFEEKLKQFPRLIVVTARCPSYVKEAAA